MDSFVISLSGDDLKDQKKMNDLQQSMDAYFDAVEAGIKELAKELEISEDCAHDVYYLRTRSRWTQELENKLIDLHSKGIHPNMNEFGCKEFEYGE